MIQVARSTTAKFIPLFLLLLLLAFLILLGKSIGWLPWTATCARDLACYPAPGETLSSIEIGRNYIADGARFWLIERLRNPYEANSPITFYTHNVNIGAFLYALCAHIMQNPFVPTAVITVLAFCVGLYYAYLFVQLVSGTSLFAVIYLALMASEYYFNLVFAFNFIRGWHWLALFGGPYHLLRGLGDGRNVRPGHVAMFVLYTSIGFMVGYDFLVFAFFLSLILVLYKGRLGVPLRTSLAVIFGAFAFPFALRQVQTIGGLGVNFWIRDLYYSMVIKTSFLHTFLPLPSIRDLDVWYRQHGVLRPFAIPENNVMHIAQGFSHYVSLYWIPYLGEVTGGVVLVGSAVALGLTVLSWVRHVSNSEFALLLKVARTVVIVGGAEALGLYFFAPLSVEIYLHHRFPMVISFVLLSYAFVIYTLARLVLLRGNTARWLRVSRRSVVVGVLVSLVAYRGITVVTNYRTLPLIPPPASAYEGHWYLTTVK